jgi:hypothetical protein
MNVAFGLPDTARIAHGRRDSRAAAPQLRAFA